MKKFLRRALQVIGAIAGVATIAGQLPGKIGVTAGVVLTALGGLARRIKAFEDSEEKDPLFRER